MGRIRWYEIPNRDFFEWEGEFINGLWMPGHYIVLGGRQLDNEFLVRHEMLHDLLYRDGHPAYYFEHLCGELLNP